MNSTAIKQLLEEHGLIAGAIDISLCPATFQQQLRDAGFNEAQKGHIILLANAGSRFWTELERQALYANAEHPIDQFSLALAQQLIALLTEGLDHTPHKMLYPGAFNIPLMQLGALLSWTHSSPLGLALHKEYGPWFAYRAAFYYEGAVPNCFQTSARSNAESPCLSCTHAPCVNACPGQAVDKTALFDIAACSAYQNSENTRCAELCLARNACPVGSAFRYSSQQQAHHMKFAIRGVKAWLAKPA